HPCKGVVSPWSAIALIIGRDIYNVFFCCVFYGMLHAWLYSIIMLKAVHEGSVLFDIVLAIISVTVKHQFMDHHVPVVNYWHGVFLILKTNFIGTQNTFL
ncbi:hypothetical protein ACJX0J_027939, partial [Zea mays]